MLLRRAAPLLLLTTLLAGCPGEGPAPVATPPSEDATVEPAAGGAIADGVFLDQRPEGAEPLLAVKAKSKAGDEVVFEARVGGREHPFVAERAIFTVADPALPSCTDNEGDGCASPWDYCCETPADLLRQVATVRLVDPDGDPLQTGLEGHRGLAGLKTVVVRGTVAETNEAGVFVVDAKGVWVSP